MKFIYCALCISLLLLCGCGNTKEIQEPVTVFYCTDSVSFQSETSVFASEVRDYSVGGGNLRDFLNVYLSGPDTDALYSPFPSGSWIVSLSEENHTIYLHLNNQFSRLAPNELTVACTCLAMTIFELTESETVNFLVDNTHTPIISLTKDNIKLIDSTKAE